MDWIRLCRNDYWALLLVRRGRHRRGDRLWRRNWERAEMVSGSSRTVRWFDGGSFRRGHGDDDRSSGEHAESFGLSAHVHRLGSDSGSGCTGVVRLSGEAAGGMDASELERETSED